VTPHRLRSVQPNKHFNRGYYSSGVLTYKCGPRTCGHYGVTNRPAFLWSSVCLSQYHLQTFRCIGCQCFPVPAPLYFHEPNFLFIHLHISHCTAFSDGHKVLNSFINRTILRRFTLLPHSVVYFPFKCAFPCFTLYSLCIFSVSCQPPSDWPQLQFSPRLSNSISCTYVVDGAIMW
jgi:hypothetical protein